MIFPDSENIGFWLVYFILCFLLGFISGIK